jgi:outer membrane protein assembly factor BamE (lipoprotein component of BamABCDE complex)
MRAAAAVVSLALLGALGCQSKPPPEEDGKQLTAGVVQREIRTGMSGAEVAAALGSPSIVTGDESGNEVWVYERYAKNVESRQSGYWVIFLWGTKEQATGSSRSFTVIIHFDKDKKVTRVGYHVVTM